MKEKVDSLFYVYKCYACIYVCALSVPGPHRGQKGALKPLDLQMVMCHHVCAKNEPGSSTRAASALNL